MALFVSARRIFPPALILVSALCTPALAAPRKAPVKTIDIYPNWPKTPFDSAKVHKYYMDGDFEEAIDLLETAIREKRTFSHDDSVFFCKHLGVMYSAAYETREKGKYYFHLLLTVEPTAKILDMYASDMIYMIFKNIQDEYEQTRVRLTRAEDHARGDAQRDSTPSSQAPRKGDANISGGHPWIWAGAGAALVAAGAATYFILNQKPGTRELDANFPNP